MHNFMQSLFICLFLKWITSNGSSLPKDLNSLKSVICPFTGLTDFIVPVRDCSTGSKLSENQH